VDWHGHDQRQATGPGVLAAKQSHGRGRHDDPRSIGGFVSYGCIRMYNADVLDLYNRVSWGTTVVVTR
jgi:lipoprotein-anchoring transpeptidase ErfK/SrfK